MSTEVVYVDGEPVPSLQFQIGRRKRQEGSPHAADFGQERRAAKRVEKGWGCVYKRATVLETLRNENNGQVKRPNGGDKHGRG